MQEMTFNGRNLDHMATAMVQAVEEGILKIYRDGEDRLRRDLGKLTIVEKPYGYKLEAVRDEFGHADVGTALAICLPRAIGLLAAPPGWQATDDVTVKGELSDVELAGMPAELRDLFDADPSAPVLDEEDSAVARRRTHAPAREGDGLDDIYGGGTRGGKGRPLGYDPHGVLG